MIRIHVQGRAQTESARPLEFNLADFGGQLPQVGDLILPPGGPQAQNELWEVLHRVFDPGRGFDAASCLLVIVRSRPADLEEIALFA